MIDAKTEATLAKWHAERETERTALFDAIALFQGVQGNTGNTIWRSAFVDAVVGLLTGQPWDLVENNRDDDSDLQMGIEFRDQLIEHGKKVRRRSA